MTQNVGMTGHRPQVVVRPGNPHRPKYRQLWGMPMYREAGSRGERLAQTFLQIVKPSAGAEVIDFGCGTGRGSLLLAVLGKLKITMVDFAGNCLDEEIAQACTTQPDALRFVETDLTKPLPVGVAAQYGYCTDVLEHVPPENVNAVLDHILLAAQHVFFAIDTMPDRLGPMLLGEPLHLTVKPYEWWAEQFRRRGCLVHYSSDTSDETSVGYVTFYVTAWTPGDEYAKAGEVNTDQAQILANVRRNITQGWTQVSPFATNDTEVMILGGGPSLAQFADEIHAQRAAGVKLITLNGTYQWALDHGLTPSAAVVVDARPFNARFVKPVVDGCKYFIASQCDPSVFEGLPRDRTYIWHTSNEWKEDPDLSTVLTAHYGRWWHVPGGSTILLRAIPLFRMLGFRRFHLYGCDSCLADGDVHHAYAQPENDKAYVLNVTVGGRMFRCHPWMASQAAEFIELIKGLGDVIELEMHGDGLLSWTLTYAARQDEQSDGDANGTERLRA